MQRAGLFNNVCMSLLGLHLDMKDWSPRNSIVSGQRWGGGGDRAGETGGIERDERGGGIERDERGGGWMVLCADVDIRTMRKLSHNLFLGLKNVDCSRLGQFSYIIK
jgi:hypothetical protein